MKRIYFGTDGVRGPYGGPVINENFAARLGLAVARWTGGGGEVVIGRDTRASGPALETAIAAGLRAGGLTPVSAGVAPTPAVARAVVTRGAKLGVVITASHNPAADNGIKFFAPGGRKLTDAEEAEIEAFLPAPEAAPVWSGSEAVPRIEVVADYVAALTARLPAGALRGCRIVTDTAHGATCESTPAALRGLGAEVEVIGGAPDGLNINDGVGSEHAEGLVAAVRASGAMLGVAHDGDGDRCVLCDETGFLLDGDEILAILALDALRRGVLPARTLVVTVQSNLGLDAVVGAAGGKVERTDVGDRHVLERMRAVGAQIGGESSGHIIDLSASPTGDGLAAALGVIAIMHASGRPLSALRGELKKFPQGTKNLMVAAKRPLEECVALRGAISALEAELGAAGRVMVRFSGTEPKLRLLAEAGTPEIVAAALERLAEAARQDLDVK